MSDATRTVLTVVGIVVGVLVLIPLLWGGAMMGGMMGGWGSGGMMGGWGPGWGWGSGLGIIAMIAFWALLGGGIYLLVRAFAGAGGASERQTKSAESPLDILKRRYAAGEITREEFEQAKKDLS